MSRRTGLRAIVIALLLPCNLAGCFITEGDRRFEGIVITNDTNDPVRVSYVVDRVETSLADDWEGDTIEPGATTTFSFGMFDDDALPPTGSPPQYCTSGDVVIRTLDGDEVRRISPPACEGQGFLVSRSS